MSYLIQQMWICLLLAALLGGVIGWWLRNLSCRNKLKELDDSWKNKLEQSKQQVSAKLKPTQDHDIGQPEADKIEVPVISELKKTSYKVEEIEGIGSNYGKKLRDIGISTTQQLLDKCCTMDGRIDVAEHIGIEDFVVQKWASMSDLMRVQGIEGQNSELMVYAGIDSVQDLAQQNAGSLYNSLSTANEKQNRVKLVPETDLLVKMIDQAKTLNTIMQDIE